MNTEQSGIYQRWKDGFIVRRMRRDEGQQVAKFFSDFIVAADLELVLDVREDLADDDSRSGFYVGELQGQIVASLAVTQVADDQKCASYLYVAERYRQMGLASRVIAVALDIIDHRQNWTGVISMDAIHSLQPMYEKIGAQAVCETIRYQGVVSADVDRNRSEANIIDLPAGDAEFERLMSYDDKCFIRPGSAWRRAFLSRWLKIPGGRSVMAVNGHGDVIGYACRRPVVTSGIGVDHLVGPLYVDSYDVAWDLLHQLTSDITGQTIEMQTIEPSKDALRLVGEMNLKRAEPQLIRMYIYRCSRQSEALSRRVYAITSNTVCGF